MNGWKLVPEEPTDDMLRNTRIHFYKAEGIYKDMLAAAPTPEVEPVAYAAKNLAGKWSYIWRDKDDVQGWINLQHQSRDDVTYIGPIPLYTQPATAPEVKPVYQHSADWHGAGTWVDIGDLRYAALKEVGEVRTRILYTHPAISVPPVPQPVPTPPTPSDEPDAWRTPGMDLHHENREGYPDWTPLYTHPASDELRKAAAEIISIWDGKGRSDMYGRAIEKLRTILEKS